MGVSYQIYSIHLIYDKECHIRKIMGVSYQICSINLIYDRECNIRINNGGVISNLLYTFDI